MCVNIIPIGRKSSKIEPQRVPGGQINWKLNFRSEWRRYNEEILQHSDEIWAQKKIDQTDEAEAGQTENLSVYTRQARSPQPDHKQIRKERKAARKRITLDVRKMQFQHLRSGMAVRKEGPEEEEETIYIRNSMEEEDVEEDEGKIKK